MCAAAMPLNQLAGDRAWRATELAVEQQPSLAHKIVFVVRGPARQQSERVGGDRAATLILALALNWPGIISRIGYDRVDICRIWHRVSPSKTDLMIRRNTRGARTPSLYYYKRF